MRTHRGLAPVRSGIARVPSGIARVRGGVARVRGGVAVRRLVSDNGGHGPDAAPGAQTMIVRSCHSCGDRLESASTTVCPRCGTRVEAAWGAEADAGAVAPFRLPGDDGTIEASLREEMIRRDADWKSREGERAAAVAGRVEPVMRVLAEARAGVRPVAIQLDRGGAGTGVAGVSVHVDDRSAGHVDARVAIALRRMHPETWETVGPTMADLRRDGVLRNLGWSIELGVLASRSFALDPDSRSDVGDLVDALQRALDVAEVPLASVWQLSVAEPEAAATSLALDEAWMEDASAEQFRQRLTSLARLRGGRIAVRLARNDHLVLEVTVRRQSDAMHVVAKVAAGGGNTGGHWKREWTQAETLPGAPAIFADLRAVLAERLPEERSPVAIRLEERPAEFAWQKAKDTGWLIGWVVGLLVVAVPWALLADVLHADVPGALARIVPGVNARLAAALIVVPALSSMAFVFLTSDVAARLADRRSMRYASGVWMIRIAAAIGSAVYCVALVLAGDLVLPVAVAPAILLVVVGVVRLFLR